MKLSVDDLIELLPKQADESDLRDRGLPMSDCIMESETLSPDARRQKIIADNVCAKLSKVDKERQG